MANINLGVKPKRYRFICVTKTFFEHRLYTPFREPTKIRGFLTTSNFEMPQPPRNVYIFDEDTVKRLPERHFKRID